MSLQAIGPRTSPTRVYAAVKRGTSKLSELPLGTHTKQPKAKVKAQGSCAGMVSWSLNTSPAQRKNILAEGSCGGMVSWSLNTSPAQRKNIMGDGSCAGMVSWSLNQGTHKLLLN